VRRTRSSRGREGGGGGDWRRCLPRRGGGGGRRDGNGRERGFFFFCWVGGQPSQGKRGWGLGGRRGRALNRRWPSDRREERGQGHKGH
jgi:hypothetical protein